MSPCALCKMIQKFEATGQLGILPGSGRKRITSSSVENVATAVVEACSQSPHGNVGVPVVSVYLICRNPQHEKSSGGFCIFIPTKSSLRISCSQGIQKFVKLLHVNSLLEWRLTSLSHGIFCGVTKPTFALMQKLAVTIADFGQVKTRTLFRNNLCILIKSQCGAVLLLNLSLGRIFLKRYLLKAPVPTQGNDILIC